MQWRHLRFLSNACILGYSKLILCMFNGDLQTKPLGKHEQMQTKPTLWHIVMGGLESLVRFAKNLWEEFVFEVFFGPRFFLSAKHRAGSYQAKTPREGWYHRESLQQVLQYSHRWFHLYAVADLVQFSMWDGMEQHVTPQKRFTLDVGHRHTTAK